MIIGSPNEKVVPKADGADFAIELPSFYVLVTAHGSLYDIYNKNGNDHLRANIDMWNNTHGSKFLRELNELDQLYDKLYDRLQLSLIALDTWKIRLEYFKETGKILP